MSQFKVVAEDVILPGAEEAAALDTVVELDPSDEAVKALFDAGSIELASAEEQEGDESEDESEEEVAGEEEPAAEADEPAADEVAGGAAEDGANGERHSLA